MQDNFIVKLEENNENVPVDLHQQPAAFPAPTSYTWNKDGRPLTGHELTYSNVTFATVRRQDAGNYSVSATSFVLGSTTEVVGTDTGGFTLDVLCELHAHFVIDKTTFSWSQIHCLSSLVPRPYPLIHEESWGSGDN